MLSIAWALIVLQVISAPIIIYGWRRDKPWIRKIGAWWLTIGWIGVMIFLMLAFRRLIWLT